MSVPILEKLFSAMQSSKGLPALESTVTSILDSLSDHKKGNADVVAHIIEDFALTQKVLTLVNSPMYAPFANGIASISSALTILGADTLMHIVLGTAMASAAELESAEHLSKTLLASELAKSVCTDRVEDVSIAALMYDLGSLMATTYLPDEMAAIQQKVASGTHPDTAAMDVLGMTLQQVGAEVAKRWRLPAAIVSIINGSGDPTLVAVAKFSSSASSLIHEGKVDEANALVAALDIEGVDKSKLAILLNSKAEKITPRSQSIQTTPPDNPLEEVISTLSQEKKKTAEELASAMFPVLVQSLEAAHCLLFMQMQSGDFNVRYGYGKGIDALKGKLRISAQLKPTAFHAVIKNKVDISISDVSKLKAAALPDHYRELLPKVEQFIILPIANNQVHGLVYFDWERERKLSPSELASLRKLRDLFLPFIPH